MSVEVVELATSVVEVIEPDTGVTVEIGTVAIGGGPGLVRNNHGTVANKPRVAGSINMWVGSVTPVNADTAVDLIVWVPSV